MSTVASINLFTFDDDALGSVMCVNMDGVFTALHKMYEFDEHNLVFLLRFTDEGEATQFVNVTFDKTLSPMELCEHLAIKLVLQVGEEAAVQFIERGDNDTLKGRMRLAILKYCKSA